MKISHVYCAGASWRNQSRFPIHFRIPQIHSKQRSARIICIDVLPVREALDVVYTSTCDYQFKRGIRINEYRTWILRGWKKGERRRPEYVRTIESPYNGQRLQSQAHAMFLKTFYGVNVRLINPDGNTEIEIQGYKTSSKVTVEELHKAMNKYD